MSREDVSPASRDSYLLRHDFLIFFLVENKRKWKRKSFVTAGETWLVIPSFIRSWTVAPNSYKEKGIHHSLARSLFLLSFKEMKKEETINA